MTNLLSNPQPLEEMPRTVQTAEVFFHVILFLSHFTLYMYLRGGRGVGGGENMRHLALPRETESRPATFLHVTNGNQNDPVNNINNHLNTTCRGWALPSGNWSCVSTKMMSTPGTVNSNGQHETTTRTSSGRCKMFLVTAEWTITTQFQEHEQMKNKQILKKKKQERKQIAVERNRQTNNERESPQYLRCSKNFHSSFLIPFYDIVVMHCWLLLIGLHINQHVC